MNALLTTKNEITLNGLICLRMIQTNTCQKKASFRVQVVLVSLRITGSTASNSLPPRIRAMFRRILLWTYLYIYNRMRGLEYDNYGLCVEG